MNNEPIPWWDKAGYTARKSSILLMSLRGEVYFMRRKDRLETGSSATEKQGKQKKEKKKDFVAVLVKGDGGAVNSHEIP